MNEADARQRLIDVDWKDDKQVARLVNQCIRQKEDYRTEFEQQALLNIAWFMGHQNLYNLGQRGRLTYRPPSAKRVNLIYNQILPLAEQQMSQLGAEPVVFDVMPATDDQQDAETAETGRDVLAYYQEVLNWEALEEETDQWCVLAGEAYVKVCWDPLAGEMIDLAELLDDPEVARQYGMKGDTSVPIGDLDVYNVSPLALYWGPPGTRFEDAEWVLELNERSIGEICERYGVKPEDVPGGSYVDRVIYRPDDIGPTGISGRRDESGEMRIVAELWVKRSGSLPRGKHVVMVGDKVLRNGDNPYRHGRIPYVQFRMLPVPGRCDSESFVTQMLGPQSDVNRGMSQGVEIREAMASPWVLAKHGTIRNPAEWNGRAGGVRTYSGEKPEVVPGVGAPNSLLLQLQKTERIMQDIAASRDVSQAKVPTGVKSGRAIALLKDSDDQRFARPRRRRTRAWQRVGQLMLQTAAQYVTEERMIRITSEEDTSVARRFTGSQLSGQSRGPGVSYYDVRVRTSGMPLSRAAQMEMIDMLVSSKVLDPAVPEHRKVVLDALNLGGIKRSWDPSRQDRQNARTENDEMMAGRTVAPREFDDHQQHIRDHDNFCKRGFFRYLPPEIQLLFTVHRRAHMELMARQALLPQEIMTQVQAQRGLTLPPGTGGPPPEPVGMAAGA